MKALQQNITHPKSIIVNEPWTLRLALPKGTMEEPILNVMKQAGIDIAVSSRDHVVRSGDPELKLYLLRPQEITGFVRGNSAGSRLIDAGITGRDMALTEGGGVLEIVELMVSKQSFGPSRWVIAVPEDSLVQSPEDMNGMIISTEASAIAKAYFRSKGVKVDVKHSAGATEAKARLGLVDGIVEITETGDSLRANHLREVDTILTTTPLLITAPEVYKSPRHRAKICELALILRAVLDAHQKVELKLNVFKKDIPGILRILPHMGGGANVVPSVKPGIVEITSVVPRKLIGQLINRLHQKGAKAAVGDKIEYCAPDTLPKPKMIEPLESLFPPLEIWKNFTLSDLNFSGGPIPVIVQDDRTEIVLTRGFMDQRAVGATHKTGMVTFTNSRGETWQRGKVSGRSLRALEMLYDNGFLLIKASLQNGGGQKSAVVTNWGETVA